MVFKGWVTTTVTLWRCGSESDAVGQKVTLWVRKWRWASQCDHFCQNTKIKKSDFSALVVALRLKFFLNCCVCVGLRPKFKLESGYFCIGLRPNFLLASLISSCIRSNAICICLAVTPICSLTLRHCAARFSTEPVFTIITIFRESYSRSWDHHQSEHREQ